MMHIGVCQIEMHIPENHSLKDKRHVVKSIISQVRNKFEVSIAEIEHQDNWQIASLGIAYVSNDARHANEVLSRVVSFLQESRIEAEMLDYSIEIIPFSESG